MNSDSKAFLWRLLATASPAGFEVEAANVWRAQATIFADEVTQDSNGNSYARLRGAGPRLLLEGHIDEIGLLVSHIDDDGFCWFQPIGGWDDAALVGQRVRILTSHGSEFGVIGRCAPQIMRLEGRDPTVKLTSLWIDIGASSSAAARERVSVGDPAVLEAPLLEYGEGLLAGRGLDNRIGAWAALEALRQLAQGPRPELDIWAVATVQEEIGYWGAKTAAHHVAPDLALAIDVWHANDFPDGTSRIFGACQLGKGPMIERGASIHPAMADLLEAAAAAEGIPWQPRSMGRASGNDGDAIAYSRAGVPVGVVEIPDRYMHSPSETISLADLECVPRLLAAFARRLPADVTFTRTR